MSAIARARFAGPAFFLVALATGTAASAEISPMTRERLPEAEQLSREAVRDKHPVIYLDMCRSYAPHHSHMFDVTISTPFTLVAANLFEAVKEGKPIAPAEGLFEQPANQSVIVAVDPANLRPGSPANVAKVILRRGVEIIEPLRSDTYTVHLPNTRKGHREEFRQYRGRTSYFPLGAFASEKGDLEIVVIPETDDVGVEAVVTLTRDHLSRMR